MFGVWVLQKMSRERSRVGFDGNDKDNKNKKDKKDNESGLALRRTRYVVGWLAGYVVALLVGLAI